MEATGRPKRQMPNAKVRSIDPRMNHVEDAAFRSEAPRGDVIEVGVPFGQTGSGRSI